MRKIADPRDPGIMLFRIQYNRNSAQRSPKIIDRGMRARNKTLRALKKASLGMYDTRLGRTGHGMATGETHAF